MRVSIILLGVACGLFITARVANAGEPNQSVDAYGDPLPRGAIRRFGTTRLRNGDHPNCVAFSPDGKTLMSVARDHWIQLWDVATGGPVDRIPMTDPTLAAIVSPDGSRVASVGQNVVRMYDSRQRQFLWKKSASGADWTIGGAFSPDQTLFATAITGGPIRLWDVDTGAVVLELLPFTRGTDPRPIAFSPNGSLLASARGDSDGIDVWNLTAGEALAHLYDGNRSEVVSLAFLNDTTLISSGGHDENDRDGGTTTIADICQWDVVSGEVKHKYRVEDELVKGEAAMALAPDKSIFVTHHRDRILVWNPTERRLIKTIRFSEPLRYSFHPHSIAISPDKRYVAGPGRENTVRLWDLSTGSLVHENEHSHEGAVLSITPSPDGQLLATSGTDGSVQLWNASSGEHIRRLHHGIGWARDVEFFPDGERVVICGEYPDGKRPGCQGILEIVRLADGNSLYKTTLGKRGMCVAVSNDGQLVGVGMGLSAPMDEIGESPPEVQVWDWTQDRQVAVLKNFPGEGEVERLRFADDGQSLLVTRDRVTVQWRFGERPSTATLFGDFGNGDPTSFISAHLYDGLTRQVFALRYLRNRQLERSSSVLECLSTGDRQSPEVRRWSHAFPPGVRSHMLAVSADRKRLAVPLPGPPGSEILLRIVIFSAEDGKEQMIFEPEGHWLRSLAFSPDSRTLYSGMNSTDVLAWDVSPAATNQE